MDIPWGRTDLKPIGQIAPNWGPSWSFLLSVVHTTTHCRFYREQHWTPYLLTPVLPWDTKRLYHITELCVFIIPYVKFENKFVRARTGPDKIMVWHFRKKGRHQGYHINMKYFNVEWTKIYVLRIQRFHLVIFVSLQFYNKVITDIFIQTFPHVIKITYWCNSNF